MAESDRYDRNKKLFGSEGQTKLRETRVAIVGLGGTGSAIAQQLAFLGVGELVLVDHDKIEPTNRNRLVGAIETDTDYTTTKIEIARRMVNGIDSSIAMRCVISSICSSDTLNALKYVDWIIGCVDDDGVRLAINHFHCAHRIPYIDVATDVSGEEAGGRVAVMPGPRPCLWCLGELDQNEIDRYYSGSSDDETDEIYGVNPSFLDTSGPAVAPINCVVSGLAATEFMNNVTAMKRSNRHLTYYASSGKVVVNQDPVSDDCLYCIGEWGKEDLADVHKYV